MTSLYICIHLTQFKAHIRCIELLCVLERIYKWLWVIGLAMIFLPFSFYNFSELNIHGLCETYTQRYMLEISNKSRIES